MTKRLYIKQNIFTLPGREKFIVRDWSGASVYTIKNKYLSLHDKISVYDLKGNREIEVQREVIALLPTFNISIHGINYATIRKKLTILRNKYDIHLRDETLEVRGSILDFDFQILRRGQEIAHIREVILSWGDNFEITMVDPNTELELLLIGLVLAIENIKER